MSTLDEMIATLKRFNVKNVEAEVAKRLEGTLRETLTETLAAGASPEGTPWAPRKDDGGRAYANAAARLKVKASGALVRATITGPEVYGHFGVRGMPVRQMLPDAGAGIPKSVVKALEDAAGKAFEELAR